MAEPTCDFCGAFGGPNVFNIPHLYTAHDYIARLVDGLVDLCDAGVISTERLAEILGRPPQEVAERFALELQK